MDAVGFRPRQDGQHDRRGFGRTYVAVAEASGIISGCYTISSSSLALEAVPENLPHHPLPIILVGRLAVDRRFQRQGVGGLLLVDALRRAHRAAGELGIYAVAVEALSDQARPFHERFGFARSPMIACISIYRSRSSDDCNCDDVLLKSKVCVSVYVLEELRLLCGSGQGLSPSA